MQPGQQELAGEQPGGDRLAAAEEGDLDLIRAVTAVAEPAGHRNCFVRPEEEPHLKGALGCRHHDDQPFDGGASPGDPVRGCASWQTLLWRVGLRQAQEE